MKRKLVWLLYAIAIVATIAAGTSRGGENTETTLEGTVVDLHCYVTRGAEGADHAGCANACISRGVPAGFLAWDGTLYVLLEEKPVSAKERVAGMAGAPARVTGSVVERGGMKGLRIKSIAKL